MIIIINVQLLNVAVAGDVVYVIAATVTAIALSTNFCFAFCSSFIWADSTYSGHELFDVQTCAISLNIRNNDGDDGNFTN